MSATATIPKCRLDPYGASVSPKLRLAPTHTVRRLSSHAAGAPGGAPRVLHIDSDTETALALAALLSPEARVTHVPTLDAAREALRRQVFSVVVMDPNLLEGDGAELLPALGATPLVVYSSTQPHWRNWAGVYLPKPWTSPRKLWSTMSRLLALPASISASTSASTSTLTSTGE